MKKRIAVLISGSGSNLQAIIEAINNDSVNGEIVIVISNKADAYGITRAKQANIQTQVLQHTDYQSRAGFDHALRETIDHYQADLVILAGFMRILTAEFVGHYSNRMLNIHPSLLPKYKGLDTHQRVIDAGDSEHGCSVHFVTAQLDDGPIALQTLVTITADDDQASLQQKVHITEHIAYPKVVAWYCADKLQFIDNKLHLDNELLSDTGFKLSFQAS